MKFLNVLKIILSILITMCALGSCQSGMKPQAAEEGRSPAAGALKEPVPRKDAFFGLHFDLHPQKTDTELGLEVSEDNIRDLLRRVNPDFVQYDCKGHAGYAGYQTKVGWPSPGIVKDSLAVWRNVTREEKVKLFIHYSGVWDSKAIEEHPEWARIDAGGKRDPNATSVFSPYVDELLIPQLKEVTAAYDLDGVWADGENWAAELDYSPAALEAWRKETGYADAPKVNSDPRWLEWKMFQRRAFEKYVCRWTDALHAFNPRLELTSNWMYASIAPQPVVAKLDFLSGDYSPSLSADRARVEARYLASTGMPWDLMAWGFDKGSGLSWALKPSEQLKQEAAVVLMEGGGFQIYHQPTRAGRIIEDIIRQESEVAGFCRQRQAVSHKSTTIPQVALLHSADTMFDNCDRVYGAGGYHYEALEGALHALLELHYSVDILTEYQLQSRLKEFPLVVIPDSHRLSPDFRQSLAVYVQEGGSLFLFGEKCARLFEPILGVRLDGNPDRVTAELNSGSGVANADGAWQKVVLTSARAVGYWHPTRDWTKDGHVAAIVNGVGRGKVAAVFGPLASVYFRAHHPFHRAFAGKIARELFPDPAVEVDGPPALDVSLRKTRDGKLSLHLLNTVNRPIPDRFNFTDHIPPLHDIVVRLRVASKPQRVNWVPDGGEPAWTWKDGMLAAKIPSVHIHGILIIE